MEAGIVWKHLGIARCSRASQQTDTVSVLESMQKPMRGCYFLSGLSLL